MTTIKGFTKLFLFYLGMTSLYKISKRGKK